MKSLGSKTGLPRVRTRITSITTTTSLLLAGMILSSLYRRFHSSSSYAREEIVVAEDAKIIFREYATPDGPFFDTEPFDESKRDPMQGFRGYMS